MRYGSDTPRDSRPIPAEWLSVPPETLVVGSGPYAAALASVMGTASLDARKLAACPEPNEQGGYPRVLEYLERMFFVLGTNQSAADALRCHEDAWNWVVKLTSAGDQHALSFIFILPAEVSSDYESALAIGLGVAKIDPATTGHSVWRRSGSLTKLLDVVSRTQPMDLLPLRARRLADARHAALGALRAAVAGGDRLKAADAARQALSVFSGHEHHLDIFCRPPSHRHGNLLRGWLNASVTDGVTPDWLITGRNHLLEWLLEDENKKT
jgi:hypothetical protein